MSKNDNDLVFMGQALDQAEKALEAGEFPVGCVIAGPSGVIATGGRTCSRQQTPSEIDHAEINALKNFYSLCHGQDRRKLTIYATLEPCLMCFAAILISGICRIVYAYEDVMGGGTGCCTKKLAPIYRNAQIQIVSNMMREQSRQLFYRYFSDPQNTYLKNTMFAEYVLAGK
jgi:tRNA(adenine34) deaminase